MKTMIFFLALIVLYVCVCMILQKMRTDNLKIRIENIENRLEQYHIIEKLRKNND